MSFSSLHSIPHPLRPAISCFQKTTSKHLMLKPVAAIAARDRVIDFGKYKGKMLGTLPSTYLKWISKNLRARDFEGWAKLADEVLEDPVYRDRIEWEYAQKVLNGDVLSSSFLSSRTQQGAVSGLLDISARFRWDNEDKLGWAKIDFGLLGTSKSGRIPRLSVSKRRPNENITSTTQSKVDDIKVVEGENVGENRRRERRERLKSGRKSSTRDGEKSGIRFNLGISSNNKIEDNRRAGEDMVKFKSPFPGRESLIKKVLNRRK